MTFSYDVYGHRMTRQEGPAATQLTQFVYQGDQLWGQLNSGYGLRRFLRGDSGQLYGFLDNRGDFWYLTDKQGSVLTVLQGSDQSIRKREKYRGFDIWGVITDNNTLDRFEYQGQEVDHIDGLDLVYSQGRFYHAQSGRWLSEDPRGLDADINPYRFEGNQPTAVDDQAPPVVASTAPESAEDQAPPVVVSTVAESAEESHPNRARSNAWYDWVNPFALLKAESRLLSRYQYAMSDFWAARGYTALSTVAEVSGNIAGWGEGITDTFNPNPVALVAHAYQRATAARERGLAAFRAARSTGQNAVTSAVLAESVVISDMVGVTAWTDTYHGRELLSGRQLSTADRITSGIQGTVQIAQTAAGIYGLAGLPALARTGIGTSGRGFTLERGSQTWASSDGLRTFGSQAEYIAYERAAFQQGRIPVVTAAETGPITNPARLLAGPRSIPPAGQRGIWDIASDLDRGAAAETRLGGRTGLPFEFQVIDRFENGVATSVKTIDLGRPSYRSVQQITSTGQRYIDAASGFAVSGLERRAGIIIRPSQVSQRALDLVVPPWATPGQRQALQQLVEYGARQKPSVIVNIVEMQ